MTHKDSLQRLKERFAQDESLSEQNRDTILYFVEMCSANGIRSKRQMKYRENF